MRICHHCGAHNTDGREICKQCRKRFDEPIAQVAAAPAKPKGLGGIAGIVIVLLLVLGLLSLFNRPKPSGNEPVDNISAYVACKDWVERNLKAPTQAEWPTANEATITQAGQVWHVASYVDAPNSFNAKIRNTYTCAVTFSPDGKNWTGESLTINGTVVK
jgi:hypothetical protein